MGSILSALISFIGTIAGAVINIDVGKERKNHQILGTDGNPIQKKKPSKIYTWLWANRTRRIIVIASLIVIILAIIAIVFIKGKQKSSSPVDTSMDNHLILKLSNANHQYEAGIESWKRLQYNKAERDILASYYDISDEKSQADIEVAKVNNSLGCLYIDMGRYEEAYDYLNNAYVTFRDEYGEDSMITLASRFSIAKYDYNYFGDVETVLKTLQQISDQVEMNTVITVSVDLFIAQIYDEIGDYDNAIETYLRAIRAFDDILENGKMTEKFANYANDSQLNRNEIDEHTNTCLWVVKTYCGLGESYIHYGKLDDAKVVLERALIMCLDNRYISKKHLTTSRVYMVLAELYKEQGKLKDAEDAIDLAMNIQQNLFEFKEDYPGLVEVYDVYGDILLEKGEKERAADFYRKALYLAQASYGEYHNITAEAYNRIGEYFFAEEDYPEAETYFEQAIIINRKILANDHVSTVRYLMNIARAQSNNGEDATETISQANDLCEKIGIKGKLQDKITKLLKEIVG